MSRLVALPIAGAVALSLACSGTPQSGPPRIVAPVAFQTVAPEIGRVPLAEADTAAITAPVATLVASRRVFVLDRKHAQLRRYSLPSGALEGVVARAGDAPGQLRRPVAMAALDSGRFVLLDDGRRILSIRDSLGQLVSEARLPDGSYTSIVPVRAEGRVVVAGRIYYGPDSIRGRDLHEFDFDGRRIASYGTRADPSSPWAKAFSAVLVADAGAELAVGTLASNRVRFIERRSRAERTAAVAAGWYGELQFPSDRLLQRGATQLTASQRVAAWTRQHRLLNGIIPLAGDRMLVRFQAFDPSGVRFYYYALTDRRGADYGITRPTRVNALAARGDTLYWIAGAGQRAPSLVSALVAPATPASPRVASAAP